MKTDYFLGLDMGTSSVGWAVTDSEYRILRAKGKDLWGVREFDEANPAVERRTRRASRRRRQREVVRQGLLKSYFADAITEVDPDFYTRLENSFYRLEDKDEVVRYKYGIFNDSNYSDADYYKQFPTIFHLRKELIENRAPHDVRLVYLAVSNMFKHRGHFLNSEISLDGESSDRKIVLENYIDSISNIREVNLSYNCSETEIWNVLGSRELSRTQRKEELAKLFDVNLRDKERMPYISLVCGLSTKVSELFPNDDFEDGKYSICYNSLSYADKVTEIIEKIGADYYTIIELGKAIYDEGILNSILGNYQYLSEARVASYKKHANDLDILQNVIKQKCPEKYDYMFRGEDDGSYGAYVKTSNSNNIKTRRTGDTKKRKQEDLYKAIKAILVPYAGDKYVDYILGEIERESFLPKQLTLDNGTIPNQIHAMEMKKILDNASLYCEFLNHTDESGLSTKDRILKLFMFQIPYYIGPTSQMSALNDGNGWVVRKEKGAVLPWNIEDKIDMVATQTEFISRLVRECTYLTGENVLPKGSLLYEKFCVLNEINNIKIDGEPISVDVKQKIYEDLFETGRKITRKKIEEYLINRKLIEYKEQLSGIDITINNSLSSYGKFLGIWGEKIKQDRYKVIAEDIIFLSTIYGDSKAMLKSVIEEKYSDTLSGDEIKRIIGFKFKDWGRLSREFLDLNACDKNTGESVSIISALWDSNKNLMELLNSSDYSFKEELESKKIRSLRELSEFTFEELDNMYFSAPVKRMVWQSIQIIKEIEDIMGCAPKRIFIEMTRHEEDKKRTLSRKNELLKLLENEQNEWRDIINKAEADGTLRSKKLYLYIKQLGKCMYTGEQIDLDKLFDDNLYDIDHIYPRSKVKDDNLNNNLVLVKKATNAIKQDVYPVDNTIYQKMKGYWRILKEKNLINDEKYKRLTCRSPFTEEQLSGFIARQLVETSQGTKGVAELIKQLMPNTTLVYSKAGNVSEFRQKYGLHKCRSINEMHHAHDAYLNIVVGNVYYVKFTQNPMNYVKREYMTGKSQYNLYKMYQKDVKRGNEIAWVTQSDNDGSGTIATVKKCLAKNTPLLSRLSYVGKGGIANETLYSSRVAKEENYIPIKELDGRLADVSKYGGFTSLNPAYFIFIEYGPQNRRKKCFDVVPLYYAKSIKNDEELKHYCEKKLGYENVKVICNRIKKNSLFKLDGYFLYISGLDNRKNVEFFNATSMFVSEEYYGYIHKYNFPNL